MKTRSPIVAGLAALGAVTAFAGPAAAACVNGQPSHVGDVCYALQVPGRSAVYDQPGVLVTQPGDVGNGYGVAEGNNRHGGTAIAYFASQGEYGSARVDMNWLIAPKLVAGATPDDLIPLRVDAEAWWSHSGTPGLPTAAFYLSQGGQSIFGGTFYGFVTQPVLFDFNQVIWVRANTPILVSLTAVASGRMGFTGESTVTADPIFTIEGAYASRYTLEGLLQEASVPPGGGGTAVPEPATWALMIAGFGLTGAAVRRRRLATT